MVTAASCRRIAEAPRKRLANKRPAEAVVGKTSGTTKGRMGAEESQEKAAKNVRHRAPLNAAMSTYAPLQGLGGRGMLRGPQDVGQLCPQETAQNRIAHQALGPSPVGFLLTQFGNLAKKLLLNLCLHLDAVEFFTWFH